MARDGRDDHGGQVGEGPSDLLVGAEPRWAAVAVSADGVDGDVDVEDVVAGGVVDGGVGRKERSQRRGGEQGHHQRGAGKSREQRAGHAQESDPGGALDAGTRARSGGLVDALRYA